MAFNPPKPDPYAKGYEPANKDDEMNRKVSVRVPISGDFNQDGRQQRFSNAFG